MATKQSNQEAPKPRKQVTCCSSADPDDAGRAFATLLISPEFSAHRIINKAQPKHLADDIDVPGMLAVLRELATAANRGDLTHAEAMLMNQAAALQSLFVHLTERSMNQSHMPNLDGMMRLALRAQNQCRATLETLAAIKNPPVIYAKQVNQTSGPQQINNGAMASSQARGIENEQSKLLDARAAGETIPGHSTLEAVGKIDRAKVR